MNSFSYKIEEKCLESLVEEHNKPKLFSKIQFSPLSDLNESQSTASRSQSPTQYDNEKICQTFKNNDVSQYLSNFMMASYD